MEQSCAAQGTVARNFQEKERLKEIGMSNTRKNILKLLVASNNVGHAFGTGLPARKLRLWVRLFAPFGYQQNAEGERERERDV